MLKLTSSCASFDWVLPEICYWLRLGHWVLTHGPGVTCYYIFKSWWVKSWTLLCYLYTDSGFPWVFLCMVSHSITCKEWKLLDKKYLWLGACTQWLVFTILVPLHRLLQAIVLCIRKMLNTNCPWKNPWIFILCVEAVTALINFCLLELKRCKFRTFKTYLKLTYIAISKWTAVFWADTFTRLSKHFPTENSCFWEFFLLWSTNY